MQTLVSTLHACKGYPERAGYVICASRFSRLNISISIIMLVVGAKMKLMASVPP